MKIVGIATRAQITDYLLLYDAAYRQSVGHYGFLISPSSKCLSYLIYPYTFNLYIC